VEPEHQAAVEIEPQRAPVRSPAGSAMAAPFDPAQDVVSYMIFRTIAPQNAVPSGESGFKAPKAGQCPAKTAGIFASSAQTSLRRDRQLSADCGHGRVDGTPAALHRFRTFWPFQNRNFCNAGVSGITFGRKTLRAVEMYTFRRG